MAFPVLSHLILTTVSCGNYCNHLHFTGGENRLRAIKSLAQGQDSNPGSPTPESGLAKLLFPLPEMYSSSLFVYLIKSTHPSRSHLNVLPVFSSWVAAR